MNLKTSLMADANRIAVIQCMAELTRLISIGTLLHGPMLGWAYQQGHALEIKTEMHKDGTIEKYPMPVVCPLVWPV